MYVDKTLLHQQDNLHNFLSHRAGEGPLAVQVSVCATSGHTFRHNSCWIFAEAGDQCSRRVKLPVQALFSLLPTLECFHSHVVCVTHRLDVSTPSQCAAFRVAFRTAARWERPRHPGRGGRDVRAVGVLRDQSQLRLPELQGVRPLLRGAFDAGERLTQPLRVSTTDPEDGR